MGSKERREREKLETRAQILDAARELFAQEGVDAVTMRAIAERIDYTPTAIYYHFADKQQLITELCHEDFRTLARALASVVQVADPVERIRQMGMAYAEFGLTHPSHYRFLFMTPKVTHDHTLVEQMQNPEEDAYLLLTHTVAAAIQAGRLRPELSDVEQVAQLLWAGIHGVVSLFLAKGQDPWVEWRDPRDSVRLMIEVTTRGIVREPA